MGKVTIQSFYEAKKTGKKIAVLTAYDYTTAKILDSAGVDCLLVGDSLGMVMLGYSSTINVTMNDMLHHVKAVSRGTKNAMIVCDMPFLSYHVSVEEAVKNAGSLIQNGGAAAVKLEGGREIADVVKAITRAQIPVMGHLGLTPQSVNVLGGYRVQGKEEKSARKLIEDALILQKAGVFSIVLECVPEKIAQIITQQLDIPTIGIGAGRYCDGQVLVTQDMLGLYPDMRPKFVKEYAELGIVISKAVKRYIDEVKKGAFPEQGHVFSIKEEILHKLIADMEEDK